MNKLLFIGIALVLLWHSPAQAQDGMPHLPTLPTKTLKLKAGQGSIPINHASQEELMRVPGIGPWLAERILECRRENGRFLDWSSLREVRGIGPKKLARIQPFLRL